MPSLARDEDQEELQLLANAINLKSVRSIWQVTDGLAKTSLDEAGVWTTVALEHNGTRDHISMI
jgi:hypothetical protein